MIDLNKLEELAKAATQGEWETIDGSPWIRSKDGAMDIYDEGGHSQADANYISAANPATILELIALIRKQEVALQSATTQEIRVVASSSVPSVATVDVPEFLELCNDVTKNMISKVDAYVAIKLEEKMKEIKALTAALDAQGELTDRYQEIALSAQAVAPVVHTRPDRINLKTWSHLKRETKTTGANGWLLYGERGLLRALNEYECEFVDCAIGAAATPSPAPVAMTDEQNEAIRHAAALLQLEGYKQQSDDLFAILAAQQEAV